MAVLNEAGAENVFRHLAREIIEGSFAFYAQTISQTVQCFDYNPKCFRDWVILGKTWHSVGLLFETNFCL